MNLKQGTYRHFKGHLYEVLATARHSETEEWVVVYRALYGEKGLWVRPLQNFCETVERDGQRQPRFAYIGAPGSTPEPEPQRAPRKQLAEKDLFMAQAKMGDRVRLAFVGRLEDGTVFDATDRDGKASPENLLELVIGEEEFFIPVEQALVGMTPGDQTTVAVPSDDAFGDYNAEYVFTIERKQLPDDMDPEVGQELELIDEDEQSLVVTVVETTDTTITFDANHPLAGENLTFDIELVEIV